MKQTLTALLVVLLFATIVVLAAERAAKRSADDVIIARMMRDYEEAVANAHALYDKSTAPMLKRYGKARDKNIIAAGSDAIKRFTATRRGASKQDGAMMEQEIEKVRQSIDDQVGNAPKVTPKAAPKATPKATPKAVPKATAKTSVMVACSASFKGHTYMAINSTANWKTANAMCKKMGGHLVYIETADELTFLARAFRGEVWVGATDKHKEGDWRWGNGRPVARDIWFKNEGKGKGEDYAVLAPHDGQRLLRDVGSDRGAVGFICEWE
jgi:hypothetical protein